MGLQQSDIKKGVFFVGVLVLSYGLSEAGVTYLHSDHLGSLSVTTEEDGNLGELSTYTPFGELSYEIRDTNDASRFQYTGQELDRATELYDYGARSYDPALSQFVSPDPVQGNLPYAYANNNPVIFIDPDGNNPLLIPVVTGIGFVAFDYGMARLNDGGVFYSKEDAAAAFFTGAMMGLGGMGVARIGITGVRGTVLRGAAHYINITGVFAAQEVAHHGADPTDALTESALWPANLLLLPVQLISDTGSYVTKYYLEPAGFHPYDPAAEVPTVDALIQKYHTSYKAGRFPFGDLTGRNPLLERLEGIAYFHQLLSGSRKELESALDGLREVEFEGLSRWDRIALEEGIQQELAGIDSLMGQMREDVTRITDELRTMK